MKRTYQLIKLRVETVQALKRLLSQTGLVSLDDLIVNMIRHADSYRLALKEFGWDFHRRR
jgi:hypothetical protein